MQQENLKALLRKQLSILYRNYRFPPHCHQNENALLEVVQRTSKLPKLFPSSMRGTWLQFEKHFSVFRFIRKSLYSPISSGVLFLCVRRQGKSTNFVVKHTWVLVPDMSINSCVTLNSSLNFSEAVFPFVKWKEKKKTLFKDH